MHLSLIELVKDPGKDLYPPDRQHEGINFIKGEHKATLLHQTQSFELKKELLKRE